MEIDVEECIGRGRPREKYMTQIAKDVNKETYKKLKN